MYVCMYDIFISCCWDCDSDKYKNAKQILPSITFRGILLLNDCKWNVLLKATCVKCEAVIVVVVLSEEEAFLKVME